MLTSYPTYTDVDTTLSKKAFGYTVRKDLSQELIDQIKDFQKLLEKRFPGAFFLPDEKELHMTLMIWLSSRIDTGKAKNSEFDAVYPEYDSSLQKALSFVSPFSIRFRTLKLTNKTIILLGEDHGQCAQIRESWRTHIVPTKSTPPVPEIIHCTIAVCKEPLERIKVQSVIDMHTIDCNEPVDSFTLVRESKMRMQEFEEVKRYRL